MAFRLTLNPDYAVIDVTTGKTTPAFWRMLKDLMTFINDSILLGLVSAPSSILITDPGGVPSFSTTLPALDGSLLTNLNATQLTTGTLPDARVQVSAASTLLGRGAASGAGDMQEITVGTGLTMTGTTLTSSGGALLDFKYARKASDETVTSSTVLQDDNDLHFAIGASQTWVFEFVLFVNGPTAADMQIQLTVPSGATGGIGTNTIAFSATGNNGDVTAAAASTITATFTFIGTPGAALTTMLLVKGVVINSTTPGTVQLQWAQQTSNATAVTVHAQSYLTAQRVV
jgi:hypothetical protein